ncbi:MAG: ATP-dependent sacrificial sulfur transferase LarE [Solirubrobacteraceae bacterium]
MNGVGRSLASLEHRLLELGPVAVAVSGGVDSMTLAVVAGRQPGVRTEMFHAISPAVPPEATARVRRYASREGWDLHVLDAKEFDDDDYLSNPVDRCFYCKRHLYSAIAPLTRATLVSGTNTDDLGDYRPGLNAARQSDVRHPFVEAGIDKDTVRAIARALELADVAELPAAPCLASRIETGIAIDPLALTLVHQVERELTDRLKPETVRCRVRAGNVVIELDEGTLDRLSHLEQRHVRSQVAAIWQSNGLDRPVELEAYRRGSAFLRSG